VQPCLPTTTPNTYIQPHHQIYLGGFGSEDEAALAYDVAAVKFRAADAQTNFPLEGYAAEMGARDKVGAWVLVAARHGLPRAASARILGAGATSRLLAAIAQHEYSSVAQMITNPGALSLWHEPFI
jgi:hypothetical protein